MDKDYLPGDSTSYKEYTGEYYYDDYTSSSDLYDYTDDSYIDDSEYRYRHYTTGKQDFKWNFTTDDQST